MRITHACVQIEQASANSMHAGILCKRARVFRMRECMLRRDVMHALANGRSETTPVIVLAGDRGGEGKSMFFKGIFALFGDRHVFKE